MKFLNFLTDKYLKCLARLIKFCISVQPPKLKKDSYDQRNLLNLHHSAVRPTCKTGAKLSFTVEYILQTSNSVTKSRKTLVANFTYRIQIFLRFWG